jgi:NAD(P)-dependent dehydrogenase (short-subunit alcohol dehydrogenase family)
MHARWRAGIGYSTAQELVRMGATVVMACRSKGKALAARQGILQDTKCSEGKVIFIPLDLCCMGSVRSFVKTFNDLHLPLDCLINNAGMMTPERWTTKDGYEMVFTANHLGHFLLTTLLLDNLEKAASGRIVILSSALHHLPACFDFDNIMFEKNYSLFGTYGQSKLANLLFAKELNSRLRQENSKVTVNSLHPGCVITDFTRSFHVVIRTAYAVLYPVVLLFQKMPLQGACSSIFAASSPLIQGVTGQYLFHCRPYPLSSAAQNDAAAKRLWEESLRLVDVHKHT